jgi:hypothetical protein
MGSNATDNPVIKNLLDQLSTQLQTADKLVGKDEEEEKKE